MMLSKMHGKLPNQVNTNNGEMPKKRARACQSKERMATRHVLCAGQNMREASMASTLASLPSVEVFMFLVDATEIAAKQCARVRSHKPVCPQSS